MTMPTAMRMMKLNEEHWQALTEISAGVVPDHEVEKRANPAYSRIAPMLRMIAEHKLVVVRPEDLPEPRAD